MRPLSCLHSAVFSLNSCSQLVSSTGFGSIARDFTFMPACLLPKLRHHFALVQSPSSLKRNSILYLTTCVGLECDLMLPDA